MTKATWKLVLPSVVVLDEAPSDSMDASGGARGAVVTGGRLPVPWSKTSPAP